MQKPTQQVEASFCHILKTTWNSLTYFCFTVQEWLRYVFTAIFGCSCETSCSRLTLQIYVAVFFVYRWKFESYFCFITYHWNSLGHNCSLSAVLGGLCPPLPRPLEYPSERSCHAKNTFYFSSHILSCSEVLSYFWKLYEEWCKFPKILKFQAE